MRRLLIAAAICAVCLSSGLMVRADDEAQDAEVMHSRHTLEERFRDVRNAPLSLSDVTRPGERLLYVVEWNGVPAGTVQLQVKRQARVRGRDAFELELRSESNEFISNFYEVYSIVRSYADVESGTSYLYRRNVVEGRRKANDRLEFRYDNTASDGRSLPVSQYSRVKGDKIVRNPERPIPGPLQDPLSIIYYMRHFTFDAEGEAHRILLGTKQESSVITLTAHDFDRIVLDRLGAYDAVAIEPTGSETEENIAVTEGSPVIWVERHTRIPLLIEAEIPIGKVTVRLLEAEKSDLAEHVAVAAPDSDGPR